jgi:hypothetical protein
MALAITDPDVIPERQDMTAVPGPDVKSGQERRGSRTRADKTANAENAERRGRRRRGSKPSGMAPIARYFLTKSSNNGIPELDRELNDENEALIESLKLDRTFAIVTEWRPKVDCSLKGRAVIEKEAVSRGSQ